MRRAITLGARYVSLGPWEKSTVAIKRAPFCTVSGLLVAGSRGIEEVSGRENGSSLKNVFRFASIYASKVDE